MTVDTKVTKCRVNGWLAESEVVLEDKAAGSMHGEGVRLLKLSTSKGRNGISTSASVVIRMLDRGFISEQFIPFQDYSKTIQTIPCARVNEAAIASAHQTALAQKFTTTLAEVKKHYNIG